MLQIFGYVETLYRSLNQAYSSSLPLMFSKKKTFPCKKECSMGEGVSVLLVVDIVLHQCVKQVSLEISFSRHISTMRLHYKNHQIILYK